MLTTATVRGMLPNVGDTIHITTALGVKVPAQVTYVHEKNLWYQLTYESNGGIVRECYKMPFVKTNSEYRNQSPWKMLKAREVQDEKKKKEILHYDYQVPEIGKIFETCKECGLYLGVTESAVAYAARKGSRIHKKYRIVRILKGGDL